MGRLTIYRKLYCAIVKNECSVVQCLLRRASSLNDKQSQTVVEHCEKSCRSLPDTSSSCLKKADVEEAGVKPLLPCKEEDIEPYIPIMMVSTC